jgi:ribosomal protein S18 acetylase RimI-like enzyme
MTAALRALGVRLRALTEDDTAWQHALFAQSRPELTWVPLPAIAREHLIAQQYGLQHRHFIAHHACADFLAIEHENEGAIGRWILDRSYDAGEWRIVDIALQAHWRGRGIGGALLRECQHQAAADGCAVTLHVAHHNRDARRLYEKLGFSLSGDTGTHALMRWSASLS